MDSNRRPKAYESSALPLSYAASKQNVALMVSNIKLMVSNFIESRREGISPSSIKYYESYLNRARSVVGIDVTGQQVSYFIRSLKCSSGGKHAYFRVLRAFYNWLYSPKSGYNFNPQDNPILIVDAPKLDKRILPSLTSEQLAYLDKQVEGVRNKAIISLFADSGLRLEELANIHPDDIDWDNRLIKVVGKGNKEALAPFGTRTESLLKQWLSEYNANGRLWDINYWGINAMLQRLSAKTGLPCNAHTFRRTFASILAKRGIDSLHIMRLGRWESMAMVERYTRSVGFEDSMRFYMAIVN